MTQTELTPTASLTGKWKPYPAYKDSGVKWLGKIPEHWQVKRLKRMFRVINGATPRGSESAYWGGEIPWVTPEDLGSLNNRVIISTARMITEEGYQSCGTSLVPTGSLVLSTRAPIGHLAIAGISLCTNQGCRALVFRHNCDITFFFYQLLAMKRELQSWGQGSTFLELGKSKLEGVIILVPPTLEQRVIASFLDREITRINALVAKKERLIELLQEKRAALISHAVTKGLDPTVPMKDSGVEWLGEIPAHWEVKRVRDITELLQTGPFGSQLHSSDYSPYGIPVINPSHLKDGHIYPDWDCAVNEETYSRLVRHELRKGDIIFARRGQMGRCALITEKEAGWLCGTGSLLMRPRITLSVPSFLSKVLSTNGVRDWLLLESVGSTMDNLNTSILSRIPLPIPTLSEQQAIVSYLDSQTAKIDALISRIREGIEKLKEYSTALISAAVTGKIDVRETISDHSSELL